ncbi:MAG TPA: class E sortase [Actinophytocola sp.]|nr:class E sortase [Actinophytocola sp.]
MGTVQHLGPGSGRISGDLGPLMPSPYPRARARRPDPVQKFVRNAGEALITLGVVLLLLVVYEVYWTDLVSAGKQRDATSALDTRWHDQTGAADAKRQDHFQGLGEGEGFAKMYIPAFGADYHFTIVQGVSNASLEIGPGHYIKTAYPGQPGNFSVAGHRVGKGAPFNDINLIQSCDAVVVETQYSWFVYRMLPLAEEKQGWAEGKGKEAKCKGVAPLGGPYASLDGQQIVLPTNGGVIAPVPPKGGTPPSKGEMASLMTLTTCHPRFSDKQRLIVHAVLTKQWAKDPKKPNEQPPELKETV